MTTSKSSLFRRELLLLVIPSFLFLTAITVGQAQALPDISRPSESGEIGNLGDGTLEENQFPPRGRNNSDWEILSSEVDKVYASGDKLYFTLLGSGDLYTRYTTGFYSKISGPALAFACSDFFLWKAAATPDGTGILWYSRRPDNVHQWATIQYADVENLYSGGNTERFIYTEPDTGAAYECIGDFVNWDDPWRCYPLGEPRAAKIAVGGSTYCLDDDLGNIWKLGYPPGPDGGYWEPYAGAAADIAVGTSGSLNTIITSILFSISPDRTKVVRGIREDITFDLPTGRLNRINKISAGYNIVVVLIGEEVWMLLDGQTQWANITDGLKVKEVFAAGNGWGVYKQAVYCLTTDNTLYRYVGIYAGGW